VIDDTRGRLFFAIWPDEGVTRQLAACGNAHRWPNAARVVDPASFHVTLYYLAKVSLQKRAALLSRLGSPETGKFALVFDRVERWRGGLLVLRTAAVPAELEALRNDLIRRIAGLQLPGDSLPFRPHVTLARKAGGVAPVDPAQPVVWPVREYCLVLSGPPGRYRTLAKFPL